MPEIRFDIINTVLAFVGAVNLLSGLLVYSKNRRDRANQVFFAFVLPIVLWTVSMIIYRGVSEVGVTTLWSRILYFSAALIPFFFLRFTYVFPEGEFVFSKIQKYILPIPLLIVSYLSLAPGMLIEGTEMIVGEEKRIIFNQTIHVFYALYIVSYFLAVYFNLFKKYLKSEGLVRSQLRYIIIGTLIGTGAGTFSNLTLPFLGIFTFNWLGQATVIFMVVAIAYAMFRYQLFNIKVIATELLVFIIWIFLAIRIFLSESLNERISYATLLALVVFFGFFLIRGVLTEVSQREKLELLTKELEEKNAKLEQLSTLKSQFLSFASHQIKTPIAVVKGFAGLVYDGSYGEIPDKVKEVVGRIKEATDKMIVLLNNFLDLRRIDEGKMEYAFSDINLVDLAKDIVADLQIMARNKKLELSGEYELGSILVSADKEKLRQVIQNLIENAIKYTDSGWVKAEIKVVNESALVKVSDSGRGMAKELLPKLFEQFTRDPQAAKEIAGTGLGLYIARQITLAHKGEIWAESEGEGKGSQFYVKLEMSV